MMREFVEYERFCPLPPLASTEEKPDKWQTVAIDIALLGLIACLAYIFHHVLSSLLL